jgi:hypothetical protein
VVGQHTGAAPGRARFARRTAGGRTAFISYRHSLAVARQATALDNIDRIPAPSPADLDRLYLRTGTPVVLTGLFGGAAARRLADPAGARTDLGDLELPVAAHPVDAAVQGRRPGPALPTSLAALVDALAAPARGAGDRRVCVEHPTPDRLAAALPPPAYVELGEARDPWLSSMFLAGPGDVTHLHVDRDLRAVVMAQVFGRKRYVVVDPAETPRLAPGAAPGAPYASGLFLQHLAPADLAALLRATNAWDCVLEPGEALLIPAACWHYVEYLEVALSVGFRLRRNAWLARLATRVPVPGADIPALAARLRDDGAVTPAARRAYELRVRPARRRPAPAWW